MMQHEYPQESYRGFQIWLLCLAAVILLFSFRPIAFWRGSQVQSMGILIFSLLDILCLLMLLLQRVYWLGTVRYEEAEAAGADARRRYAAKLLFVFLAGTAAFVLYCVIPYVPSGTAIRDSIAAAVCIAIPAVAAAQIKL